MVPRCGGVTAPLLPLILFSSFATASPNSFLDIYLHVHPVDDFCGASRCNITYAISLLTSQNTFDLQSVMLQEGMMTRNSHLSFDDNTVFRLTRDLYNTLGKTYLGLMLFDVPEDMQDYIVIDVTDAINKGRRAKIDFRSETMHAKVHVYKRSEATLGADDREQDGLDQVPVAASALSSDPTNKIAIESKYPENFGGLHRLTTAGCSCVGERCSCCRHMRIKKIRLDDIVCVNVTRAADEGLRSSLSVQGQAPHFAKEMLVGDTPPMCFASAREYSSLCMRIYNFERQEKSVSLCAEVEARLYHVKVARKKLGCLRIAI